MNSDLYNLMSGKGRGLLSGGNVSLLTYIVGLVYGVRSDIFGKTTEEI